MKRPAIFAVTAVLLFVFTAASVRNYMKSIAKPAPAPQTMNLTQVVVAAEDIPLGTTLTAAQLRTIPWPADAVPAGSNTDPNAIVGWVARGSLVRNEPVLTDELANPAARGVLPLVIPAGMRAASVKVNEVSGISGFVSPGSKVDVITVMDAQNDRGKQAFTLLEDVEVLAIAQTMDHKDTKPTLVNTVTLLVNPVQAERLTLAGTEGLLQLSLRNYQDRDPAAAPGITLTQLTASVSGPRKVETAPAPAPAAVTTVEVELIRGPERIVQQF
jgi:pilus assembly protein CpaB